MLALRIGKMGAVGNRTLASAIRRLYANGEKGAWYDPSDFSTMFQDSAGTTPVTAVEQPVGKILDKSGLGNHATQATSTSRPTLSARQNLLTYSEDFSNAAWVKTNITPTAGVADPLGGTAAYTLTAQAGAPRSIRQTLSAGASLIYGNSVWMRRRTGTGNINLWSPDVSTPLVISGMSGTWVRYAVANASAATGRAMLVEMVTAGDAIDIYAGQLETGSSATRYQRVTTATDYDTAGFPLYLSFDGVDDFLVTPSIDFTGTDKMFICAGVRKASDAARGILAELSTSSANAGSFTVDAPAAAGNYRFGANGISGVEGTATTFTAPVTNVLAASMNLTGATPAAQLITRINAAAQTLALAGNTGVSGSFGNYPLYIGRRAGTSLPFNGRLYTLIVRGALTSAADIAAAERYVNSKTGAY